MSPPAPPPRSVTGGSQRSYSTYSNPTVDSRTALTGVSNMCGRSGRSVVTKIGPDLIQRLQARQARPAALLPPAVANVC